MNRAPWIVASLALLTLIATAAYFLASQRALLTRIEAAEAKSDTGVWQTALEERDAKIMDLTRELMEERRLCREQLSTADRLLRSALLPLQQELLQSSNRIQELRQQIANP